MGPWPSAAGVQVAGAGLPREQVAAEGGRLVSAWGQGRVWAPGELSTLPPEAGLPDAVKKGSGSPGRPLTGSETPPPDRPSKWGLREAGGPALLPPPNLPQAEQPPEGRELGACRALGPASPWPFPAAPSPSPPQPLQRLPGSLHSYSGRPQAMAWSLGESGGGRMKPTSPQSG